MSGTMGSTGRQLSDSPLRSDRSVYCEAHPSGASRIGRSLEAAIRGRL